MGSGMAQGSSTEPEGGARRLGPYEIHAGLSVGGMAELYLASLNGPGGYRKFVALKKILSDVQSHDRFLRMFRDEAHITAALSHKNITQVYDLGEAEDELYLAMEYILGLDLARMIRALKKRNELPPIGLSVRIIRDVCTALDYAHRFVDAQGQPSPIVHRDITPKNVMVGYDGQVKIIDFGVALAKNKLDVTAVGTIKGTAAYMSPEQVRGKRVDGRSDLYSAGVVLFELLTGQRLFGSKLDVDLFRQILNAPIPNARELNPGLPEGLVKVLELALAKNAEERFETGMQMAEALHEVARDYVFDTHKTRDFMCTAFADKLNETRAMLKFAASQSQDTERRKEGGREEITVTGIRVRGATVLAVDGSSTRLLKLQNALQLRELRVIGCASASEALESLKMVKPDLMMIASQLPRMSGFDLCRRIREGHFRRHLPILFMSPDCALEERAQGLMAGGDDFVRLPFDPGELAGRVRGHLLRAAMMRELLSPRRSGAAPARKTRA